LAQYYCGRMHFYFYITRKRSDLRSDPPKPAVGIQILARDEDERSVGPEPHQRSVGPEPHQRSVGPEPHQRSVGPEPHQASGLNNSAGPTTASNKPFLLTRAQYLSQKAGGAPAPHFVQARANGTKTLPDLTDEDLAAMNLSEIADHINLAYEDRQVLQLIDLFDLQTKCGWAYSEENQKKIDSFASQFEPFREQHKPYLAKLDKIAEEFHTLRENPTHSHVYCTTSTTIT
jgi:hypothetical protein